MRAYFFCFIWLCLGCLNGFSQQTYVPFPCRVLSQQDVQTTGNNLLIRQENCIETSGNILVNNPESVLLESGQSIHLKPGFKAAPGTAEQFNARINRSEVGLVIYEPAQTPGQVPVFEKFELGVDLPDTILQLVERYVAQPRQYPNINPFNPDEISIEAQFFILNENGQFHPFPDGMWMGPGAELRDEPAVREPAEEGQLQDQLMMRPHAHIRSLPPGGAQASLRAAGREA